MAEMKYAKSVKKLDDIIQRIESEDIDVDDLALKVKEAVGLLEQCRKKIEKADMEVKQVVARFEDSSGN